MTGKALFFKKENLAMLAKQKKKLLMTAEDLFNLPDDGFRYELVRGELIQMSPAGRQHGKIAIWLGWKIIDFVNKNDLGEVSAAETGFKIERNPDTVRAPDVGFVRKERIPSEAESDPAHFWPIPPDLAVEVVSPSDSFSRVHEKISDWLSAGVPLIWVVDPRTRAVTVYHLRPGETKPEMKVLQENDELKGEEVLPGFSCKVAEIFA